jgi:hypothetical protein
VHSQQNYQQKWRLAGVIYNAPTEPESNWCEYYPTLNYIPRQPVQFTVALDDPITFYLMVNIDYLSKSLKKI